MKKHVLLTLGLGLILSCNQRPNKQEVMYYMPSTQRMENGIVNKYYYHYKSADGFTKKTNIVYRYYTGQQDTIKIISYNDGLKKTDDHVLVNSGEKLQKINSKRFYNNDTVEVNITQADYLSLNPEEFAFETSETWKAGWNGKTSRYLLSHADTLVLNTPGVVQWDSAYTMYTHPEKEDIEGSSKTKTVFVKDLGLYHQTVFLPEGVGNLELVEQMHFKDFEKTLLQHNKKRVAYINPEESLSNDRDFELCGTHDKIIDYYNTDPDSHYFSKDSLRMELSAAIDTTRLKNESGYLTYRFVLNCKGQTGYFITEEASLDFEQKQFDGEVKDYLFSKVVALKNWKPAKLNGEERDHYAYITFKLQDGEIIELLP